MTNIFYELAEYRRSLGLPAAGSESDRATIAELEIGDKGMAKQHFTRYYKKLEYQTEKSH